MQRYIFLPLHLKNYSDEENISIESSVLSVIGSFDYIVRCPTSWRWRRTFSWRQTSWGKTALRWR